jgi:hypothetical protein
MESKRLEIRIDPKLKKQFYRKADASGITPSLAMRLLIIDWVDPITTFPLRKAALRTPRSDS